MTNTKTPTPGTWEWALAEQASGPATDDDIRTWLATESGQQQVKHLDELLATERNDGIVPDEQIAEVPWPIMRRFVHSPVKGGAGGPVLVNLIDGRRMADAFRKLLAS